MSKATKETKEKQVMKRNKAEEVKKEMVEKEADEGESLIDRYSIAGLIPRAWRRSVIVAIDSLV